VKVLPHPTWPAVRRAARAKRRQIAYLTGQFKALGLQPDGDKGRLDPGCAADPFQVQRTPSSA